MKPSIIDMIEEAQTLLEDHIDYDADENNVSPEDNWAYTNGLIWKKLEKIKTILVSNPSKNDGGIGGKINEAM